MPICCNKLGLCLSYNMICWCGVQGHRRWRSVPSAVPGTESSSLWLVWVHGALWSGTERPAPPSVCELPKPAWSNPASCRIPSPGWEVKPHKEKPQCSGWTLPFLLSQVHPLWSLLGWQGVNDFNTLSFQSNERWRFDTTQHLQWKWQKQDQPIIAVACVGTYNGNHWKKALTMEETF